MTDAFEFPRAPRIEVDYRAQVVARAPGGRAVEFSETCIRNLSRTGCLIGLPNTNLTDIEEKMTFDIRINVLPDFPLQGHLARVCDETPFWGLWLGLEFEPDQQTALERLKYHVDTLMKEQKREERSKTRIIRVKKQGGRLAFGLCVLVALAALVVLARHFLPAATGNGDADPALIQKFLTDPGALTQAERRQLQQWGKDNFSTDEIKSIYDQLGEEQKQSLLNNLNADDMKELRRQMAPGE